MRYAVAVRIAAVAASVVLPATAQAQDACPNAGFRAGQAASLPDCRAYEQVSPIAKNGFEANPRAAFIANPVGDRAFYASPGSISDPDGMPLDVGYVSARGADWSTVATDPPLAPNGLIIKGTLGVSEDNTKALVVSPEKLTADARQGDSNLYVRDLTRPDAYELLYSIPGRNFYATAVSFNGGRAFYGASPDFSAVAFVTPEPVLPGGPSGVEHVYVWHDGEVTLASRRADGTPVGVIYEGVTPPSSANRVLPDGTVTYVTDSRDGIYRSTPGEPAVLVAGTPGGGPFGFTVTDQPPITTADGTLATFFGRRTLEAGDEPRLYRYDARTNALTDVAPTVQGAEVYGVSPDAEIVWISARTKLTPDAEDFVQQLYVVDATTGTVRLVARLNESYNAFRLSPNGRRVAFTSYSDVTGTDVENPACQDEGSGRPGFCGQVYTYDARTPDVPVTCLTCLPGVEPTASAEFGPVFITGVSGATNRPITDDGRVFFDTRRQLVPQDGDSAIDVYQYTPGRGLVLLSSGTSGLAARFGDAGLDGRDVFVVTAQRLVPQDTDSLADVYDVRTNGGIAAQQVPPPSAADECVGSGCRAAPGPQPARPTQGSAAYTAPQPGVVPRFSVRKPTARQLRAAARRGRLTLRVTVNAPGRVTASLRGAASSSRRATRAQTLRLPLRLNRRGQRKLRRGGKLRLTVAYSERLTRYRTTLTIPKGGAR